MQKTRMAKYKTKKKGQRTKRKDIENWDGKIQDRKNKENKKRKPPENKDGKIQDGSETDKIETLYDREQKMVKRKSLIINLYIQKTRRKSEEEEKSVDSNRK